ncbi:MAG: hypothetical protein HYT34_00475 [Candidatus Ryanbacteria bacterium]|nr:hypothetical protein [Candidatus Ryanbacteria bacterium]
MQEYVFVVRWSDEVGEIEGDVAAYTQDMLAHEHAAKAQQIGDHLWETYHEPRSRRVVEPDEDEPTNPFDADYGASWFGGRKFYFVVRIPLRTSLP